MINIDSNLIILLVIVLAVVYLFMRNNSDKKSTTLASSRLPMTLEEQMMKDLADNMVILETKDATVTKLK